MSEHEPQNPEEKPEAEAAAAAEAAETVEITEPEAAEAPETAEAPGAAADAPMEGGESPWSGGTAEQAADAAADPAEEIARLEGELAEVNDKLLRALAETENVRRRAGRDREDALKFAIKNFAEGMLSVADNLGRALSSIDADARAADPNLENLFVGVDMVQRELTSTFERYGIQPIKALGDRFDPMLHEAMFEIEDADTAAGTIAQVLEPGYTLHGRTLRAAKVGVTKGGPKPEAAQAAEDAEA